MPKKEPLYPHIPKSKETQFPHHLVAPSISEEEITMYHVTPIKNLDSILSNGLKPRSQKAFAELQESRGIYLANEPIIALNVLRHTLEAEPKLAGDYALLEVRVSKSELEPDPDYQSTPPVAFITKETIPPRNIQHIATINGQSRWNTGILTQTWGDPLDIFFLRKGK